MNKEELLKGLKDNKFMRKLGMKFCRSKDMSDIAFKFGFDEEDIEDLFIDYPELEDQFNQAVYDYSRTLAYRKIRAGLDEAITRLNEYITDYDEDPQISFKSASALLSIWARIDTSKMSPGGREEKDDLDEIWEQVTNETATKEDLKNLSRII